MLALHSLDSPLALDVPFTQVCGKKTAGRFGVELELEGEGWGDFGLLRHWNVKEEGSLRGGWEFVLPRPRNDLTEPLKELQGFLEKTQKTKYSIRCSTHIHVNILSYTQFQLFKAIFLYYLVEDLLVQTQGPLRQGNLFCLRMSDAHGVYSGLYTAILTEEFLGSFSQGNMKYGALNLAAPMRFGSVEFRFFRPMEPQKIGQWASLLSNLLEYGAQSDFPKLLAMLDKGDCLQFLNTVLPPPDVQMLTQGLTPDQVSELLLRNLSNIMILWRLLERKKKPKKFSIPENLLDDDLVGSPYRAGFLSTTTTEGSTAPPAFDWSAALDTHPPIHESVEWAHEDSDEGL